jgi:hypothetical protein
MVEESCSPYNNKEEEREINRKEPGTRYTLQRHTPSDLLSPTRPYLLIAYLALNSSMG